MKNQNIVLSSSGLEALQARYALRVAARLNEASRELPHDISERLKAARENALERARLARRQEATASDFQIASGGSASLLLGSRGGSSPGWWMKLVALIPVAALVGGFLLIERLHLKSQIEAAAEIDAALLADDVPPAAYSDPGFVEFLKAPRD
ncbi:DUF3619 family protein [Piscinibacter sp. XHJ-5]|uniref:DUF3619 family protein n=1 Tax=Piscinibacter sp. XHJ-5 TaxID=3037797 RepID=UPI0024536E5E|nr:DUF3619 family protein [Piscinibacter sp. XHJ-5]